MFRQTLHSIFILLLAAPLFGNTPLEDAVDFTMAAPKGWNRIDDPKQLPQKIKLIYIGQGKTQFTPSINIAKEETDLPIQQYITTAKQYHEGQGGTHCQLLGTMETEAGLSHLLQIDRQTQWGEVRFIQAVVIENTSAYVITATSLKQEFNTLAPLFFQSIGSFNTR